jgi:hypothetical protein
MSSIFGHDLGAVYRDPAYALRARASWLAIGAAFAVGMGAAVAVMKVPAGQTEEPTQTTASRGATKPSVSPARAVADRADTRAKAPVRVIAPDTVPPPPNVTMGRQAPRAQQPKTLAVEDRPADPNAGAAARDQVADSTASDAVPMPPAKPSELRAGAAEAPTDASTTGATAALPPPLPPAASVETPAQEPGAKLTRREAKAARREARRLAREERRRMAQERLRARQERFEAENWAPPLGRGYTIYRRYDDDRGRAMAYGDEYRRGRRGFFGLFDFD